ncbi:hypothetical protein GCM10023150_12660 [Kangiella taiwanensis]|uniref:Uncharacterized protein n=1 Tax=Kangiella taiwanensis TaxID=1079179 RepID=A0ABP8I122_9GAMM
MCEINENDAFVLSDMGERKTPGNNELNALGTVKITTGNRNQKRFLLQNRNMHKAKK